MGDAERDGGLRTDRGSTDRVGVIIPGSGVVAQQWRDEDGRWWSSVVPAGTREDEASNFPITGPPPDWDRIDVMIFHMAHCPAKPRA